MALRIVLIDDDDDARELLAMLLGADGHQVVEERDGRAGLERVRRDGPDVVLVDLQLPELSGLEVAKALREDGSTTHLVALTGRAQESDRVATAEAGFDHHVTKPVDLAALRAHLREVAS
ncbi:MAG: response regulator [Sandaracinus sp.]|nr:response regulator [Sandaracinus sp.]MCB9618214.1 response regulator [Sandaracinus sp.]MCB9625392.1 response regulator [Sandaracinus sp.]MCB9636224.1 response regulator [Sandaracinus sp.]